MINILIYSLIPIINIILILPNTLLLNNKIKYKKNSFIREININKKKYIDNKSHKIINNNNDINILMMLPLFKKKPHLKNESVDFLIGAKAAIKFLSKTKKIKFQVFDTENNKEKIKKFLKKENYSSNNVIIGPLFRSNIEEVAKILKNSKIPIISPFSNSKQLDMYPNVFQTKSKDESLIEPIFKEIKKNKNKNNIIYLIGVTKKNIYISKYLKSLFLKEKISINIKELKSLANIKNVKNPFFAIFLSEDIELGKLFVKDIQKFSNDQIIPFGIGYNNVYYNNIEILKKYNFIFTVRYHINNNKSIYNIINKLKKENNEIPNKHNLLGFDITLDTCERILNNNFLKKSSIGLISKYRYQKIPYGGYVNKGIWLIKFIE